MQRCLVYSSMLSSGLLHIFLPCDLFLNLKSRLFFFLPGEKRGNVFYLCFGFAIQAKLQSDPGCSLGIALTLQDSTAVLSQLLPQDWKAFQSAIAASFWWLTDPNSAAGIFFFFCQANCLESVLFTALSPRYPWST